MKKAILGILCLALGGCYVYDDGYDDYYVYDSYPATYTTGYTYTGIYYAPPAPRPHHYHHYHHSHHPHHYAPPPHHGGGHHGGGHHNPPSGGHSGGHHRR